MFTGSLTRGVFFRWTPVVRSQSTDAFPDDLDAKETQRLKDEETEYENDIKVKILDAALGYVDISGWSKEALAQGAKEWNSSVPPPSLFFLEQSHFVQSIPRSWKLRLP